MGISRTAIEQVESGLHLVPTGWENPGDISVAGRMISSDSEESRTRGACISNWNRNLNAPFALLPADLYRAADLTVHLIWLISIESTPRSPASERARAYVQRARAPNTAAATFLRFSVREIKVSLLVFHFFLAPPSCVPTRPYFLSTAARCLSSFLSRDERGGPWETSRRRAASASSRVDRP